MARLYPRALLFVLFLKQCRYLQHFALQSVTPVEYEYLSLSSAAATASFSVQQT